MRPRRPSDRSPQSRSIHLCSAAAQPPISTGLGMGWGRWVGASREHSMYPRQTGGASAVPSEIMRSRRPKSEPRSRARAPATIRPHNHIPATIRRAVAHARLEAVQHARGIPTPTGADRHSRRPAASVAQRLHRPLRSASSRSVKARRIARGGRRWSSHPPRGSSVLAVGGGVRFRNDAPTALTAPEVRAIVAGSSRARRRAGLRATSGSGKGSPPNSMRRVARDRVDERSDALRGLESRGRTQRWALRGALQLIRCARDAAMTAADGEGDHAIVTDGQARAP
jgi:hypothetical protein